MTDDTTAAAGRYTLEQIEEARAEAFNSARAEAYPEAHAAGLAAGRAAGVEEAHAAGYAEGEVLGRIEFRQRAAAIMQSPETKGREDSALHLALNTPLEMDAEAVIGLLATLPRASAVGSIGERAQATVRRFNSDDDANATLH